MISKYAIPLLILIFSISCTNSQSPEATGRELMLPDMVLDKGTFTLYQETERPIVFTAERASFYSADSRATIENISFTQSDVDGEIILEGRADYGELDTETERLLLRGNVMLNSRRDEMMIETDGELLFDTRTQEVETDSEVRVQSSEGEFSSLSFYGNLLREEYSFSSLSSGRIVI